VDFVKIFLADVEPKPSRVSKFVITEYTSIFKVTCYFSKQIFKLLKTPSHNAGGDFEFNKTKGCLKNRQPLLFHNSYNL